MSVGNGCGQYPDRNLSLCGKPHEIRTGADHFHRCSTVSAGRNVSRGSLAAPNRVEHPLTMRAGIETADGGGRAPPLLRLCGIARQRSTRDFAVPRNGAKLPGPDIRGIFQFPKPAIVSDSIPVVGARHRHLRSTRLLARCQRERFRTLSEHDTWIGDPARWSAWKSLTAWRVYENLRALPRMADSETKPARPEEIKAPYQTSRLPDGRVRPGVVHWSRNRQSGPPTRFPTPRLAAGRQWHFRRNADIEQPPPFCSGRFLLPWLAARPSTAAAHTYSDKLHPARHPYLPFRRRIRALRVPPARFYGRTCN